MLKGIIENNQVHLFGWEFLVVGLELIITSLSDSLEIRAGFINEWSFSDQFSIFIKFILSLEISEEVVGHELFIIETK
jgi:hypothetical protein